MPIINCNENEQPTIRWTYPGEVQQARNANEYQFEGAGKFDDFIILYKIPNDPSRERSFRVTIVDFEQSAIQFFLNGVYYFALKATEIYLNGTGNQQLKDYVAQEYPDYAPVSEWISTGQPVENFRFEKIGDYGWTRLSSPVIFTVKNNGSTVFTRTERFKVPEIETECRPLEEDCPPNTCKVICGNVACCYGSDGVAVSSFNL